MKKRSSKEIFAEALLELAAVKNLNKISVKQIVDHSGLSLQTFYNHFKDKSDLVLWIHKSEGDRLVEKLMNEEDYTFHDLSMDNIRFYLKHRDFILNAMANTEGQDSYFAMSNNNAYIVWKEFILRKYKMDSLPEKLEFQLRYCVTAATYMYYDWAVNRQDMTPEAFSKNLEDAMPPEVKKYLVLGTGAE